MPKFIATLFILSAFIIDKTCGLNCWTEVKTTHPEGFGLSLRKMRCPIGSATMQCAQTKCVTDNGYTTIGKACADQRYCETTRRACEFGGNARLEECDLCYGDYCNGASSSHQPNGLGAMCLYSLGLSLFVLFSARIIY